VADFTGSENVKIDIVGDPHQQKGAALDKFIVRKDVRPKTSEDIAEVRLFKNWKLKSKFRFTLKNPHIEEQRKFIGPKIAVHS
jgi:hypothetical protein